MREIKFRAYNPKTKQMKQVDYINLIAQFTGQFDDKIKMRKDLFGDETIVSLEGGFLWNFDDGIEIMQYTGLKDKNGKEIYEGDVVEIDTGAIGEVIFDTENAYFCIVTKTGIFLFEDIPLRAIKVIGNIFENKELLNA